MRISLTWRLLAVFAVLCFGYRAWGDFPSTAPVRGLREKQPTTHAFIHARVVASAERIVEDATLVIRDGVIVQLEAQGKIPADAKVHDATGKTIYPGLIDAYSTQSLPNSTSVEKHSSSLITPQLKIVDSLQADNKTWDKLRRQGVVVRLVAPASGILRGQSGLVALLDNTPPESILNAEVGQHARLGLGTGRGRDESPNSPMGAVALARQTLMDADWYGRRLIEVPSPATPSAPQPNAALVELNRAVHQRRLFIFDATSTLNAFRADQFAREFGLNAAIRGSGQEYQELAAVAATGRTLLVPVNFPKAPYVETPEASLEVSLSELMHWELAPENPARLANAGVRFALTSFGLENASDFLSRIRTAVSRGFAPADALRALTETPAKLFGVEASMGTLEVGKRADMVITDGELFQASTKILETWIAGHLFPIASPAKPDIRGTWRLILQDKDKQKLRTQLVIEGTASKPTASLVWQSQEDEEKKTPLKDLQLIDRQLVAELPEGTLGIKGTAQLSMTLLIRESEAEKKLPWRIVGTVRWPDGSTEEAEGNRRSGEVTASSNKPAPPESSQANAASDADQLQTKTDKPTVKKLTPATPASDATKPTSSNTLKSSPSLSPVVVPFNAFGLKGIPDQPQQLLIQNATVWTCGDAGVLKRASVLIEHGKILRVSQDPIEVPEGTMIIDAQGKHLTPGIIDCHSHIATDGGVNESSQAITCEVRMSDFIDSHDIQIYRQLAGGVTTINVLHGSANPIGGQNQVLKLRWGQSYESMKMQEAPAGVKFALGENVKQSNLSSTGTRYPQSRMGVEQIIRDAFQTAREYQQTWARWNSRHDIPLPRKDLELEALVEILEGKRLVHCHSYRQDEILALLRLCEEFGIQIATLQHILEGYKVADVMAKHGAMGSSFSDWWAYKIEVIDAIPYNGALMHRAGVTVSFNSDDSELARHLNHEAAKAVKYGRVEPEDALKFVTLNPAKQLRIDGYVGSIEPGKQADFVLWSGEPLSMQSRCEQTWIDGRCYFDREADQTRRTKNAELKNQLIQKILRSDAPKKSKDEPNDTNSEEYPWLRYDEFCQAMQAGAKP